jgi:hypothetical protein
LASSVSSSASSAATGTGGAYKTALLAKIKQQHIDEQARLQKELRRELEASQLRQRQLELAAKRERQVAALTQDAAGIAYDYDDCDGTAARRGGDDDDDY